MLLIKQSEGFFRLRINFQEPEFYKVSLQSPTAVTLAPEAFHKLWVLFPRLRDFLGGSLVVFGGKVAKLSKTSQHALYCRFDLWALV